MGSFLLSSGTKGKRYALPHAKIMIHQPWGYVGGQVADMQIQAKEILRVKQPLAELLARHTNKSVEQISQDIERDRYMTAEEAKEYGIIDEILDDTPEDKKK
jgi:ATP-dependent Clp protease protease subunit